MNEAIKQSPITELKERHADWHVGKLIVGGYAPVKAVLVESDEFEIHELTPAQKNQWAEFKKDPLHGTEPDFRVLEDDFLHGMSREEIDARRSVWQHTGRFALNRYGRSQATAAGLALYLGFTDSLILTGGANKPGWVKNDNWPSEAELMKDIIVHQFGRRMFEKKYPKRSLTEFFSDYLRTSLETRHFQFDKYVEARYDDYVRNELSQKILLEDHSVNMIEQVVNTANRFERFQNYGVLFFGDTKNRDLDRFGLTAQIFLGSVGLRASISTNSLLWERAQLRENRQYQRILLWMSDPKLNPDLSGSTKNADRWWRSTKNPEYFWYWGGYLSLVSKISTVQNVFDFIHTTTGWEPKVSTFINEALSEYYDKNNVPASERKQYADFVSGTPLDYESYSALRESVVPWYGRGSRRENHLAPELP